MLNYLALLVVYVKQIYLCFLVLFYILEFMYFAVPGLRCGMSDFDLFAVCGI